MRRLARMLRWASPILCLAAATASSPGRAAPFTNGDFETGLRSPWFQGSDYSEGVNWNVSGSVAHTGSFSATNTGNKQILQTFDAIPTNTITQLSFYARHDNVDGHDLAVTLIYSDQTERDTIFSTGSSTDWVFFDVTHILLAGRALTGFGIYGNSVGCSANCTRTWLDDVVILQVPEPGVLPLLSLGLAGLSGRRLLDSWR